MDRDVRYCTTEDGVRIAYCVTGDGPALLACPYLIESFALDHMVPQYERFMRALEKKAQLIRFDMRGTGMSGRDVRDFSLQALVRDIDAVVTATRADSIDVWAGIGSVMRAIAYAAGQPQRVRHLVLYEAHASGADWLRRERLIGLAALARSDWWSAAHVMAASSHPPREFAERAHAIGEWNRKSVGGEALAMFTEALSETSVADLLPLVTAPTLILHPARLRIVPMLAAQNVAAQIADSRMRVLESGGELVASGDMAREVAEAVESFLHAGAEPAAALPSGMTAILFTDIADSTQLTERMGDARFRDASRALDAGLRTAILDAGGVAIDGKLLGDGVLATFPSAAQAIGAARRCLELSAASELALHIGVHAGDVIREADNVYGGAVNIASRICALSGPGEILASDVVRGMARSSAGVAFEDRGEQEMKGIAEPVRVFAVRWRE